MKISRDGLLVFSEAAFIVLAVVVAFWNDLRELWKLAVTSDMYQYVLAVPLLSAFLVYRKRKTLMPLLMFQRHGRAYFGVPYLGELSGFFLALAAFLIYFKGSSTTSALQYHLLALPVFLSACVIMLFGYRVLRVLAFPILFLLFLIPPPMGILSPLISALTRATTVTSYTLLKVIGVPITTDYGTGLAVDTLSGQRFAVQIALECSGLYSFLGYSVFAVFLGYLLSGGMLRRVSFLLVGYPLLFLLNVIRVDLIMLSGYFYGPQVAMRVFHGFSETFLIIIGVMALLYAGERIWGLTFAFFPKEKVAGEPCPGCGGSAKAGYFYCVECGRVLKSPELRFHLGRAFPMVGGVIFLSLLMYTSAPPEFISIPVGLAQDGVEHVLPSIPGWDLSYRGRHYAAEKVLNQTATLHYLYSRRLSHDASDVNANVWVLVEIADSRAKLHGWEYCIPYSKGYKLMEKKSPPIPSPMGGGLLILDDKARNTTALLLYWIKKTTFSVDGDEKEYYVKTTLTAHLGNFREAGFRGMNGEEADLDTVAAALTSIGKEIAGYWYVAPLKSNVLLFNMITRKGTIITLFGLIALGLVLKTIDRREQERALRRRLRKPGPERNLVEAVRLANQRGIASGRAVRELVKEKQGLAPMELAAALESLEKQGFLEKEILVKEEAYISWKPVVE